MKASRAFRIKAADTSQGSAISWFDSRGKARSALAGPQLLTVPMAENRMSRRPATYPRKRNTQGYYWFSQLRRHIWCESMEEYSALMYLDYSREVIGLAAQPMRLDFDAKSAHFPDYFVEYADGQAGPMNVRPVELIDDRAHDQFAATKDVCDKIGWSYRTFEGLAQVERFSLEWIAAYRHQRHAPSDDAAASLRELIGDGAAFGQIWSFARRASRPYVLAGLYHQMWRREVLFDLEEPLEMNSWIWTRTS